jgi:hypothetical protein
LLAALVLFIAAWNGNKLKLNTWAWRLFRLSVVTIGLGIGLMFYQISQTTNASAFATSRDYGEFGAFLAKNMQTNVTVAQQSSFAQNWLQQNGSRLDLSFNSNPVEFAALVALFVSLLMTIAKAKPLQPRCFSLSLMRCSTARSGCRSASTLLLIAVWANGSGRYWGRTQRVGSLVLWMAFAHTVLSAGKVVEARMSYC